MIRHRRQAWDMLPNARPIDWVIADLGQRPEAWVAARYATRDISWADAFEEALVISYEEAAFGRNSARGEAVEAVRDTVWQMDRGVQANAWPVARNAVVALIVWDDSVELFRLDPDAVRLLAASGHAPAVLLYPACIVRKPSNRLDITKEIS